MSVQEIIPHCIGLFCLVYTPQMDGVPGMRTCSLVLAPEFFHLVFTCELYGGHGCTSGGTAHSSAHFCPARDSGTAVRPVYVRSLLGASRTLSTCIPNFQ